MLLLLIKCSDVSVEVRPQENSSRWVKRLFDEFFAQGTLEKSQNLPVASQMDAEKVNIANEQVGFIKHVLLPVYEALAKALPKSMLYLDAIHKSLKYYEEMSKK